SRNTFPCLSSPSTNVVLPWSTCAMIATFRISLRVRLPANSLLNSVLLVGSAVTFPSVIGVVRMPVYAIPRICQCSMSQPRRAAESRRYPDTGTPPPHRFGRIRPPRRAHQLVVYHARWLVCSPLPRGAGENRPPKRRPLSPELAREASGSTFS